MELTTKQTKERVLYLDVARVVAIVLIALNHAVSKPGDPGQYVVYAHDFVPVYHHPPGHFGQRPFFISLPGSLAACGSCVFERYGASGGELVFDLPGRGDL
jgi:hypothetical protein